MYLPDILCPRNVYELRFLKYTFTTRGRTTLNSAITKPVLGRCQIDTLEFLMVISKGLGSSLLMFTTAINFKHQEPDYFSMKFHFEGTKLL